MTEMRKLKLRRCPKETRRSMLDQYFWKADLDSIVSGSSGMSSSMCLLVQLNCAMFQCLIFVKPFPVDTVCHNNITGKQLMGL